MPSVLLHVRQPLCIEYTKGGSGNPPVGLLVQVQSEEINHRVLNIQKEAVVCRR